MGTTRKLGLNRDGVTLQDKKPAISPKRCEIGPRLLLRTNKNSYMRFRLVPKSLTFSDPEGRNQGVPQVFTFVLLSQERVKLQTSALAWVHPNKRPLKIFRKRKRGHIQGLLKVFRYPLLSQERYKLRAFSSAGTFTGSI